MIKETALFEKVSQKLYKKEVWNCEMRSHTVSFCGEIVVLGVKFVLRKIKIFFIKFLRV